MNKLCFLQKLDISLWWFFDKERYSAYQVYIHCFYFSKVKAYRLAKGGQALWA